MLRSHLSDGLPNYHDRSVRTYDGRHSAPPARQGPACRIHASVLEDDIGWSQMIVGIVESDGVVE